MRFDCLERLIKIALEEDIGPGDLTTELLVDPKLQAEARVAARAPMTLSGLEIFREVYRILDPLVEVELLKKDSEQAERGEAVARLKGPAASILTGERTALNFLGRLSGIATSARLHAEKLAGLKTRLLDTRKTAPGLRALEKKAVLHGGGFNHRLALFDGILIKDNHIAAVGGVRKALELARKNFRQKIEIEVDTSEQFYEALQAEADIILLDNMDPLALKEACDRAAAFYYPGQRLTLLEASGGITLGNIRDIALSGVDFVSVGAITHSAPYADLGLDFEVKKPSAGKRV
ncbi:MAG: carboxylating nicotinate-nucleotide diphosphorylase [Deltaproteobacteria bacterium]|jgi:nicotinate-nucleotide pyrophosphorylase (carboxylating)|nr:carboxylating nicotinate-nucleotide diphosphorylase [Deltaproteobacteria bacterium]